MALPTPLKTVESNSLGNDPTSTTSTNTSSVRRSGRRSAKTPVNYYQPANKSRNNAKPSAKRQKISDASSQDSLEANSSTAIPTTNHNPTTSTPRNASRVNTSNKSPVITKDSNKITGTHLQTAPRMPKSSSAELSPVLHSKNPLYQGPAPAPSIVPQKEISVLPCHYHRARIPRFSAIQIRDLLRFNSNKVSRRHVSPGPKASLPTVKEDMVEETRPLRTLVRAAASHYSSLPREYGDLESCLPHLYKTFIPTAKFESWMKESGGLIRERDIHIVLMEVFEIIFSRWLSCAEAEEKIWGLLGFEEEEEEESEEKEEWEGDEKGDE